MEPLRYPTDAELKIKRGWWNAIPVVGLTLASQRRGKTFKHVRGQLEQRGYVGWASWESHGIRRELKEKVDAILKDKIGWPEGATFHPDDPFQILIDWRDGDLCEVEALMDIEYLTTHDDWKEWAKIVSAGLTYAEFLRMVQTEAPRPSTEQMSARRP